MLYVSCTTDALHQELLKNGILFELSIGHSAGAGTSLEMVRECGKRFKELDVTAFLEEHPSNYNLRHNKLLTNSTLLFLAVL